jgi:5-formyltetrahydrofolate cyclo-ligase
LTQERPLQPPVDNGQAAAKRLIRARIKALRAAESVTALAQQHLDALLEQLLHSLQPRAVFCYLSTTGEVDTRPVIDALLAAGVTVLVPSLVDRTTMVATEFPGWSALVTGALGIPSPPGAVAHGGTIDAVLVPGLAFSIAGGRLGYGAGYYDRWLAGHPAALRIGLCFESQLLADLPLADHDEPLDYLITERRLLACPSRTTSDPLKR